MDSIVNLIISLVAGAIGGNAAGAAMKDKSLGTLGNSIAGIIGGGVGGQILAALGLFPGLGEGAAMAGGQFDIGALIGNIAGSGVGGAILMAIIGIIKQAMGRPNTP